MVYSPAEDSFFLSKEIEKYISEIKNKNIRVLDMGSGSGIQAQTLLKSGIKKTNILCADIDKEALKVLKKQNLKTIESDLFSKIRKKFNLIIFNAPYLPEDKYDKGIDTTAGKKGCEIIIKFLKEAKDHLYKNGVILLLFSSLSKPNIILKFAKKQSYQFKKISELNLGFFEKLFIYRFILK
jgi:release factor glutamine methyltransferase